MQNRAYTIWHKLFITAIIIGVVLILAKTTSVRAQITPLLNFAGKVTNVDGSELADGTYDFNFALYTQATGGAAIWTENLISATRFSGVIAGATENVDSVTYTYSGESATTTFRIGQYLSNASTSETALVIDFNQASSSVTVASGSPVWSAGQPINNRPYVEGGVVDINFGSVTDLSGVNFNQSLYLEVTFNGEVMQPRKVIVPTAQAFQAERVGNKTEAEIAGLADDETITGEWSFNNILNIATSSIQSALTVTQNGSGNIAEFKRGATSSLILLADGRVTIGDYTFPASRAGSAAGYVLKVDAVGNMYWDNDAAGSGGGSGLWASSSDGFIYQSNSGDIVVLGNNATTTNLSGYHLQVIGGSWLETVAISNQNELRFYDADSSNYMAIRASSTLAGNYILTLPVGTGIDGQALITDGSGMLSWGAPSSFIYVNPGTTGQIGYYATDGSTLSATSSIYLAGNGNIGIGTTTPSYLFTVDGQSGFSEVCLGGTCITDWTGAGSVNSQSVTIGQPAYWFDADTLTSTSSIEIVYGGTGRSGWTQYAIPYLTDSNTFGELAIGSSTYLMAVNASGDGYEWVEASSTGVVLTQEQVDDFVDALINDPDSQHSRITITYDDADNAMDFVVDSNLANYNNSTSQFFSTTTDNLGTDFGGTGTSSSWWTGLSFVQAGTWGPTSTLSAIYGGTGFSSYTAGDILYSGSVDTLNKLGVGANGMILSVVNGLPEWTATSSLGMDFSEISGILPVNQGGTGQNFASTTGFIYLDNGVAIASATIAITHTDLAAVSGVVLNANTLSLDTSGNWSGTFDNQQGSYYLDLANATGDLDDIADGSTYVRLTATKDGYIDQDVTSGSSPNFSNSNMSGNISVWTNDSVYWRFASTTVDHWFSNTAGIDTDGLDEGSANLYWTDVRFDARLDATTSLPKIIDLSGLSLVGTIATGTWEGDVIEVAYGGTGFSSITNQSLVYASSDNVLSGFTIGNEGEVLAVVGGNLAWATTSAPAAHSILSVSHSDAEATSTLARGDLMVVNSNTKWSRLGIGPSGYILYSNGTDAQWSTTTAITALGSITVGAWLADTIDIAYGGTGATTAVGARNNLDLDEAYKFGVNSTGTVGWLWQSDGDGRGQWVATSSLGLGGIGGTNQSKFIGTTTETTNGEISTSTLRGYEAANYICNSEYTGSYFCRTYDILVSIEQDDISTWDGSAWIAEGPPGYTSNSNDCNGWIASSSIMLGAFWVFDDDGGGAGWLTNCSGEKSLACCQRL